MGKIGRFLDYCVTREPELMQRVLDRPWGTLNAYHSYGPNGEHCGCLVGSIAIEIGQAHPEYACCTGRGFPKTYVWWTMRPQWLTVARGMGLPPQDVAAVGHGRCGSVVDLAMRMGGLSFHARRCCKYTPEFGMLFAIDLLKRRIARRLDERIATSPVHELAYEP